MPICPHRRYSKSSLAGFAPTAISSQRHKPGRSEFVTRDIWKLENISRPIVSLREFPISLHAMAPSVLYTKIDVRPPEIVRSEGNYLETSDGRKIFDASGGAAVACVGHNDPRVKEAIIAQLGQTAYVYSPFFTVPAAEEIATFLTESTGGAMSKVFIVSSGVYTGDLTSGSGG
jgi:hypothetical protein